MDGTKEGTKEGEEVLVAMTTSGIASTAADMKNKLNTNNLHRKLILPIGARKPVKMKNTGRRKNENNPNPNKFLIKHAVFVNKELKRSPLVLRAGALIWFET